VEGQDLGIGPPRRLEHPREAAVVMLQCGRRKVGHDRFANAVVVGLDYVAIHWHRTDT
jgi:hypothetical protein